MSVTMQWSDKVVKPVDYVVYIGRFQPFHNGHYETIKEALNYGKQVIIGIGSHRTSINSYNPWITEQRIKMIKGCFTQKEKDRFIFLPLRDYPYSDSSWKNHLEREVYDIAGKASIRIIGHLKNDTSYIKFFNKWESIPQPVYANGVNGTEIRNLLFNREPITGLVPTVVESWLEGWRNLQWGEYLRLRDEWQYIKQYRLDWQDTPFPVNHLAVDALVIHSGHILMVQRKGPVGADQWALPGGFVNTNETLLEACLRELKEETSIGSSDWHLKKALVETKVFDKPNRALRGRIITHVHKFDLNNSDSCRTFLPYLRAKDDAQAAKWVPILDVFEMEENVFTDHIHIIREMLIKENKSEY